MKLFDLKTRKNDIKEYIINKLTIDCGGNIYMHHCMRKKHEDKNNPNIISKRMRWNENITCENNKQTFFMKEKIASFLIDFTDSK